MNVAFLLANFVIGIRQVGMSLARYCCFSSCFAQHKSISDALFHGLKTHRAPNIDFAEVGLVK